MPTYPPGSQGDDVTSVVFVHHAPLDRREWTYVQLRADLSPAHLDRRAFREPDAGSGGDVAALRSLLTSVGPALVVASVDGAVVALTAALEQPDDVRGLVLLAPRLPDVPPSEPVRRLHDCLRLLADADFDDDAGAEAVLDDEYVTAYPLPGGREELLSQIIKDNRGVWRSDCSSTDPTPPLGGRLGELRMPMTVVVGTDDAPDAHETAALVAERCARARLVRVEGAGRLLALERPDAVTREIHALATLVQG